jgi:hypothetical protein
MAAGRGLSTARDSRPAVSQNDKQHTAAPVSLSAVRFFSLVLVGLPVLLLAAAIPIARSHWFMEHAVPPYLRMLDAESDIHDRHCDVLIFGDSTALTGLMPWVVQQDTGLTTCSVAQTKGSIGVNGLRFLREYLERNPAPRVLVLAFSPEDWRPIHTWSEVAYSEGVLQLVRHDSVRSYLPILLHHPSETIGFATFVYKSTLESIATHGRSATWPRSGSVRDGHMTLPASAESRCLTTPTTVPGPSFTPVPDYARSLRREFTTSATSVLLVAPDIPDCDPMRDFFALLLNPVLDRPVATQPIGDYNDLDRHFTRAGAELFSSQVAQLIHARANESVPHAAR